MRLIDADALIEEVNRDLSDRIEEGVAIEKIMNAPTIEPEWIPCSKQLPEDGTEVFVYLFDSPKSPYVAWIEDCRWYTEDFEVESENEPIAWMSLPEPYKGEGE